MHRGGSAPTGLHHLFFWTNKPYRGNTGVFGSKTVAFQANTAIVWSNTVVCGATIVVLWTITLGFWANTAVFGGN